MIKMQFCGRYANTPGLAVVARWLVELVNSRCFPPQLEPFLVPDARQSHQNLRYQRNCGSLAVQCSDAFE
jgi:hypothetical protein